MELEPGNDDECSFEQIARENWQDARWEKLALSDNYLFTASRGERHEGKLSIATVGGDTMTRIQGFSVIHVIQE